LVTLLDESEPKNIQEALNSPNKDEWLKAMDVELEFKTWSNYL